MVSHRLQTALDLVRPTDVLVDVGTDHGYLALAAIQQDIAQTVIATDNKIGPLAQARKNIEGRPESSRIILKQGDGLAFLTEPYDTIVIAGMGGSLMARILSEVPLNTVKQIVLQPSKYPEQVRQWASDHRFTIEEERFIEDAGMFYVTLSLVPKRTSLSVSEVLYGPCLLQEKSPLYRTYLEQEFAYLSQTLAAIPHEQVKPSRMAQKHAVLEAILREWKSD